MPLELLCSVKQQGKILSTLNGFGTLYYGWRHTADGTATATKWLAVSWLPIIPLRRDRLRSLTNFNEDGVEQIARLGKLAITRTNDGSQLIAEAGGLIVSQVDYFDLIEKLPLSPREILITLAKAYIALPLVFIIPMLIIFLLLALLGKLGMNVGPGSMSLNVFMGGICLCFANFLYQCVRAVRRTRGWQPRIRNYSTR